MNSGHQRLEFDVADVRAVNNTYDWISPDRGNTNNSNLFQLQVVSCTNINNIIPYAVQPADMNNLKIPVIGDIILVFRTINQNSKRNDTKRSWYYLSTVDMNSSMIDNRLPGVTWTGSERNESDSSETPAGTSIKVDRNISPLQPYEGDILYQGRWGNSIRFGSTISTVPDNTQEMSKSYYNKPPTWSGESGDPIIILSNGRTNLDNKEFVVEDINTDNSSIYLTSTQKIPIVLGSDNKPNSLTGCITLGGNESQYIGSQLLGVSDRVILKARKDLVVIDSPLGIVLNSTGEIKLGSEDATESMVHGDVLLDILSLIINQFNTVIDPNTYDYINKSNAIKAQQKLKELLSSKYFINKNTY